MNTKIERKFDCFLMKTFCVETNYKNLYGWGVWAVIADMLLACGVNINFLTFAVILGSMLTAYCFYWCIEKHVVKQY